MIGIVYNAEGRVTTFITGPDASIASTLAPHPLTLTVDALPASPDRVYVFAGKLAVMPDQPSPAHEWSYQHKAWVVTPGANRILVAGLRRHRDRLLADSDWTQVPDAPLTEVQVAAWREYRQALRDLPAVYTDVQSAEDVVFPEPPA